MPLYEYRCSDCKTKFELLVSHFGADEVVCTKCHSDNVRRLLSLFATIHGENDDMSSYDDMPPAMGSCGCGGGSCGCN
jgi:putative FmdB family regulatory protein